MNTDGRIILVVEDEPLIRFALCDYLLDLGFHVLEAKDALSAIGVFGKAGRIDAVISDVDMPGDLNGLDFAFLVARSSKSIPVILTTARTRQECGALPAQVQYLSKPYDEGQILTILNEQLALVQLAAREARKTSGPA